MDEINAIIAAVMSFIFSLPMIWAVFLIIRHYIMSPRKKLKHQLRYVIIGIVLASVISIISEFLIPAMRLSDGKFSLMYLAIFALVILLFFAIVRHQFLNVQLEYIYQNLFMFSHEGIILIDKDMSILSINQAARAIFKNVDFNGDIRITQCIGDYDFNEDYAQHETTAQIGNDLIYLLISQSPIDSEKNITVKLLHIINITPNKRIFQMEIEQLIEQSKIDKLTGLYNKRYFMDNINDQKLETVGKLTLIFIDIDNFKHVNDSYGHLAGDEVIKAVAQRINKVIRKDDIGIRYGGDEFLIILENTGMEDAKSITDRIQEEISTIEFDQDRHECARCPKITISIGLCEGNKDINSLLEKADKAMYYSKSNGKNKSTVYDDSIVNIRAS
jgi:diguanylate cyclase (GGDEF)-like protein